MMMLTVLVKLVLVCSQCQGFASVCCIITVCVCLSLQWNIIRIAHTRYTNVSKTQKPISKIALSFLMPQTIPSTSEIALHVCLGKNQEIWCQKWPLLHFRQWKMWKDGKTQPLQNSAEIGGTLFQELIPVQGFQLVHGHWYVVIIASIEEGRRWRNEAATHTRTYTYA